ncbi:MAG TPA: hypothetical protein DD502_11045 [Cupriavidus sp.]|nr:hypothetical protein [Cupriavidus sp.]
MAVAARFLPADLIARCASYRDACLIAWQCRSNPNLQKRSLAELCGLYAPHVTDFFNEEGMDAKGSKRRELPAEKIADVERVLGNRAISQYLARRGMLTLMEEVIAARTHG